MRLTSQEFRNRLKMPETVFAQRTMPRYEGTLKSSTIFCAEAIPITYGVLLMMPIANIAILSITRTFLPERLIFCEKGLEFSMLVVVGGCISSLTWEKKIYLRELIKELI